MEWIEITLGAGGAQVEELADFLEGRGIEGLIIEDENDFNSFLENNRQYWDYVDEELVAAQRGLSRVKFYLSADAEGRGRLSHLRSEIPAFYTERGLKPSEPVTRPVCDEDWENNWKEFYKPIEIGSRLIVVPEWEEPPAGSKKRVTLRLDPGLTFGTGYHATTQMCLEVMEGMELDGAEVLDLGCGSGILGIAALLLGAGAVVACDIDAKARDAVRKNLEVNFLPPESMEVLVGDLLSDNALFHRLAAKRRPLVLANIVADVIIPLSARVGELMTPDGVFVCSGIIEGRQNEVQSAIEGAGLIITAHRCRGEWHSFSARRGG